MTDEVHEHPARLFALACPGGPGRHAGQLHAVFDDVEELAIRQGLCRGEPHVRDLRIQTARHVGVGAAVVAMARSAMIGETRHAVWELLWRLLDRFCLW